QGDRGAAADRECGGVGKANGGWRIASRSLCCCRPREGGDPYAVCFRCCTACEPPKARWLWVPAFAGTTAIEAELLSWRTSLHSSQQTLRNALHRRHKRSADTA